jgi:glycosyltransferase involved in cell wall biosynthesis
MKILLAHNFYKNNGGEDVVFQSECDLLRSAGHEVRTYTRSNNEIGSYGPWRWTSLAPRTLWAWDSYNELQRLIASFRPEVAHFHNIFPLISPAAYFACRKAGVAVVQTLHNPRLVCPAATLHRNGAACEACSGRAVAWPAIQYGCYRNSRAETGVVAAMLATHRALGTWSKQVHRYIVATDFFAQRFSRAGLPADKIRIKPHFVLRNRRPGNRSGEYALFVGRLAAEKGLGTLLRAWQDLRSIPLRIRGDGPLLSAARSAADDPRSRIEWLPRVSDDDLLRLFQEAAALVWPSEGLYESFGLVAVEAFACGIPVIASNAGAMAEVVRDHITGLHFRSGDASDLAAKVKWAWSHREEMHAMGNAARIEYESRYTPERNYKLLIDVYEEAIEARAQAAAREENGLPRAALSPANSADE